MHTTIPSVLGDDMKSQILENFSDGLILLDRYWKCQYANDAVTKIIQRPSDELLGQVIWEFLPATVHTDLSKIMHEVVDSGNAQLFDLPFEPFAIHLKGKVCPLSEGIMLTFSDKIALEEEITTKQKLLENIIESNNKTNILGLNTNHEYLFYNKAHEEVMKSVYGKSPSLGVKITDLMSEDDDIDDITEKYNRALSGETVIDIKKYGPVSNRSIYETRFYPIKSNGKISALTVFAENVTERELAKEKLSIAENIITNSSSVAFLWKNQPEWPVEYVSENISHLVGYSPDDFISGRVAFASIIHPDDLERVVNEIHQFSEVEKRSNFEHKPYRLIHKDGSVVWVDNYTNVRKDPQGVTHFSGLVTNITEKIADRNRLIRLEKELEKRTIELKISEKKLQERELQFSNLYDASGDGLLIHDISGRIKEANKAMCELLEYTHEEFVGMIAYNNHPPYEVENGKRNFEKLLEDGKVYFESDFLTKSGGIVHGEVFSKVIQLPDGPVIQSIFKNITERKKSQQEIETLKTAIDQSANSVVMADLNGNITYVNERLLQTTGYSREEIIGKTPRMFKSDLHPKEFYQELWSTIKSGNVWMGDIMNKKKDGSYYTESVTINPIKDLHGKTTGYLSVKEDVTEIRRALKDLNHANKKYEFLTNFFPHILWSADTKGELTFVNTRAKEVLGAKPESLLREGLFDVVHPDDKHEVKEKWLHSIANKVPYTNEQRLKLKNGGYHWFKVHASPHFDENGNVDQWVGLSTDIQAEKNYSESVEENERKLQRIFDTVSDGFMTYNQDGLILSINKSGKELLGLSPIEPINPNVSVQEFYVNGDQFRQEPSLFKKIGLTMKL